MCVCHTCQLVDPALVRRSSFLTGLKGSKGLAYLPEGVTIRDFHHWLRCDSVPARLSPRDLAAAQGAPRWGAGVDALPMRQSALRSCISLMHVENYQERVNACLPDGFNKTK